MLNTKFSVFFLVFMASMSIRRFLEIFIYGKRKEKGIIYKNWSFFALALIHILVIIFTIFEYFLVKHKINIIITSIAVILFLAALILRNLAIYALGKYYSVHIEIREHHKLIANGIYRYIRHPYYLAVSLEVLSIALIPNSYYTFCFAILFYFPLVFFRIASEEKEMINRFGKEYLEYKNRTPAIIPMRRVKGSL